MFQIYLSLAETYDLFLGFCYLSLLTKQDSFRYHLKIEAI